MHSEHMNLRNKIQISGHLCLVKLVGAMNVENSIRLFGILVLK